MIAMKFPKVLLFLFALAALPVKVFAGAPEVSHVMVTDVTTRSFSVIWAVGEAGTAGLDVYEDEYGNLPLSEENITPHPIESGDAAIKTLAEDNGVMKVRVMGLAPDTTYYFRTLTTSKATSETTAFPEATLLSVTTERSTVRTATSEEKVVPFSNDLVTQVCYLEDGETPAAGTLLLATMEGAHYPLTAFVGDGVPSPYAFIDLNNSFSRSEHVSLNLSQGQNLTLLHFRGMNGNAVVIYELPTDQSLSELKEPAMALKVGWNMVSLPLEPSNRTISSVLSPILDKAQAIWAYGSADKKWAFHARDGAPFLTRLTEVSSATGYWLIMNESASLKIDGDFKESQVPLKKGWNLVGSKSIETIDLMEAIAPIEEEVRSVWTFLTDEKEWISYDKQGDPVLNQLKNMVPGKAYWVYVDEDCDW